jgi:hypothetical protein
MTMPKPPTESKPIGQINGWTSWAFKKSVWLLPIALTSMLGMQTWILLSITTANTERAELRERVASHSAKLSEPHYTPADARADFAIQHYEILREVKSLIRDEFEDLKKKLTDSVSS